MIVVVFFDFLITMCVPIVLIVNGYRGSSFSVVIVFFKGGGTRL